MNTYIDIYSYLRASTGQMTSALVGNTARIASPGVSVGVTLIPLTQPTTVALNQYDQVTIFDGSNSEVASVTAPASIGSTSITVSALQFAHAAGVSLCSDGASGSLAQQIITASQWLEDICRQPLLQTSHVNERLSLRTTRAAVTRDYTLKIRPHQFPVQSVSAISVQINASTTLNLDVSQTFIDADAQLVELAQLTTTSTTNSLWGNVSPPIYANTPGFVQISYSAGYAYAQIPPVIQRAAILLTSDALGQLANPIGADQINQGKRSVQFTLRGDATGESLLRKQAMSLLAPYTQRSF